MKTLIELATEQAQERQQFGRPIAEFGLIKREDRADDGRLLRGRERRSSMVAHFIDSGRDDYSIEAAISKVFASDAMSASVDEALQIAGGNGYMREFPYERLLRDARIIRIFEGTNEILRLFIALSGMKDVGASLRSCGRLVKSIFNDPIKGFGVLSGYAGRRSTRPRDWGVTGSPAGLRRSCTRWSPFSRNTRPSWRGSPTSLCASTAKAFPTSNWCSSALRT